MTSIDKRQTVSYKANPKDDLVERLRNLCEQDNDSYGDFHEVLAEAAEEIERLKAASDFCHTAVLQCRERMTQ